MINIVEKQDRYLKNRESVDKIGKIFGFTIRSFDPMWNVQTLGAVIELPDWIMGRVALLFNMDWVFENGSVESDIEKVTTLLKQRLNSSKKSLRNIETGNYPKECELCLREQIKSDEDQIKMLKPDLKIIERLTKNLKVIGVR